MSNTERHSTVINFLFPILASIKFVSVLITIFGVGSISRWILEYWIPATHWFWGRIAGIFGWAPLDTRIMDSLTTLLFFLPMGVMAFFARGSSPTPRQFAFAATTGTLIFSVLAFEIIYDLFYLLFHFTLPVELIIVFLVAFGSLIFICLHPKVPDRTIAEILPWFLISVLFFFALLSLGVHRLEIVQGELSPLQISTLILYVTGFCVMLACACMTERLIFCGKVAGILICATLIFETVSIVKLSIESLPTSGSLHVE